MNATPGVTRRRPHIEIPIDVDEDERWCSLGDDGFALHLRAVAYSARNLTDGRLSPRALQRLTVHLRPRHAAQLVERLVATGFWAVGDSGGWHVVQWEQYTWFAEQVAAFRATQSAKASLGGLARADSARRDEQGRMRTSASQPEHHPAGMDGHQPDFQPEHQPNTDTDADTGFRPRRLRR